MAHVWDDAGSGHSNIIDVYASRLRRKVDEGDEPELFRTVRGAGFLLEAAADRYPARPARRNATRRPD
jgi:DNA-binding response OmpR family regulator